MEGFDARGKSIDLEKYALLTYEFQTWLAPLDAALGLCREQSTALWKRVNVDEDFRPKHGAMLLEFQELGKSREPKFKAPYVKGDSFTSVRVQIAHPLLNFGAK